MIVCSRRPKKRIDGKARLKKLKTRDEHEDKLLNESMFDRTRKDFPIISGKLLWPAMRDGG